MPRKSKVKNIAKRENSIVIMEQFSHDLTLALEETSRIRAGHCWGVRRRTRSTGNLRKFLQFFSNIFLVSFV